MSAPGKKRGVLNCCEKPWVCNASATNFSVSLVFPPFSVTQTLISVTQEIIREYTLFYERYLSRKFRLPGFFYRSGAFQFNLIISNIRKSSENIPNIRNQELDCRNRLKSTAENRKRMFRLVHCGYL